MTKYRSLIRFAVLLACAASLLGSSNAFAHGIWGHVHVTGWAVENLPDGELRSFFSDPEVMNAALFGAGFTDSGYFPQAGDLHEPARAYSEHTHWEPFIHDFIAWMQANDPPPWTSLESKKRVAFLMGCASHGFQDELFDTLFLEQIAEHDNGTQDNADPGTDGFLSDAGVLRFVPTEYIPMDVLMDLYADLDHEITEEVIEKSVKMMVTLYLNGATGRSVAQALDGQYADELPWTKAHFLDPSIPGSLRSEILPTGAYMQAIWERLHGNFSPEEVVVFTFPEAGRPLLSGDAESVDSWVTLVYGEGVHRDSVSGSWTDSNGAEVSFDLASTRWGSTYSRLQRFIPKTVLEPGSMQKIGLDPGMELVSGAVTALGYELEFQVGCADGEAGSCPEQVEWIGAALDGSGPVAAVPDSETEPREADPEVEPGTTESKPESGGCTLDNSSTTPFPWSSAIFVIGVWGALYRRRRLNF